MTNELETPIGTKEAKKLPAGFVVIKNIAVESPREGSKARVVMLSCLHPDREELIKISAINTKKVQGNNITIKKETLWYNLDEDKNIKKGSSVATLMQFYKVNTLKELENKSIEAEPDASGYLVIKAY